MQQIAQNQWRENSPPQANPKKKRWLKLTAAGLILLAFVFFLVFARNYDRALNQAIRNNNPKEVERLLKAGANPDATLPIERPFPSSFWVSLQRLFTGKKDETSPALCNAVWNSPESGLLLLQYGANPNAQGMVTGSTVLYDASNVQPSLVAPMIKHGVDVNAIDVKGRTALMGAARGKNLEAAKQLLQAGADPNRLASDGIMPLKQAALNGDLPMVKLLVEHGAKVNQRDQSGATLLQYGEILSHRDVVAYLKKNGLR